jgi:hypothetical protein
MLEFVPAAFLSRCFYCIAIWLTESVCCDSVLNMLHMYCTGTSHRRRGYDSTLNILVIARKLIEESKRFPSYLGQVILVNSDLLVRLQLGVGGYNCLRDWAKQFSTCQVEYRSRRFLSRSHGIWWVFIPCDGLFSRWKVCWFDMVKLSYYILIDWLIYLFTYLFIYLLNL